MSCNESRRSIRRKWTGRIILAPLAAVAVAGAAHAKVLSDPEFSGQIGVATENIGKGIGKSAGEPSVSGSVGVAYGAFYAEFEAATVDLSGGADSELVTTFGYAPEFAGLKFDFSAMHKEFTGTVAGFDNRFWEYQADVSRDVGPVAVRLRANYTPDGSGTTEEAWWLEAQGGVAIDARTRATVALGERITDTGAEYTAWNAGVKRRLARGVAVDVRWYDTDQHALGERYEGRLVGALTYAF